MKTSHLTDMRIVPLRRALFYFSVLTAAVAIAGTDPSAFRAASGMDEAVAIAIVPEVASPAKVGIELGAALPSLPGHGLKILSDGDRTLYRTVFALQRDKHYGEADALLAQASDPVLRGTALGERYTSADYKTVYSELESWLNQYRDHPQAAALYRLALSRKSAGDIMPQPPPVAAPALAGFSNGHDKSALPDGGHEEWTAGLAAFRRHDMQEAAAYFSALLEEDDTLSDEDRAAVAFWAYRAFSAAGDNVRAVSYARQAAALPPGFYSILAREVTGDEPGRRDDPQSRLEEASPLLAQAAARRAIALKEINEDALAEQELRSLFPASSEPDRKRLISLASLLNLPAAQMRMALAYAQGGEEQKQNDSFYPMPRWMPAEAYQIEPALLFAIMRQESGFNPNARSAGGAIGVMQLMPETAHAMARGAAMMGRKSTEPSVNMQLGQNYIEHLMDTAFIGDNLIFLTAAYNAGPGTLLSWQHSVHYAGDPLLFIESIPFGETREYVEHVIANYWVYCGLLGQERKSAQALAAGKWPRTGTGEQLSSMLSHLDEQ